MAGSQWIEKSLRELLSQGDIVEGLPFCTPTLPVTHLTKTTVTGGRVVWAPSAPPEDLPLNQRNYALVAYRIGHGMVVSHDCAIDKPNRNTRILVAPVAPITVLDAAAQDSVRKGANLALMHLPAVPGIGEAYTDLRSIAAFPFEVVAERKRVVSLNDAGRARLVDYLAAFLILRQPVPQV